MKQMGSGTRGGWWGTV